MRTLIFNQSHSIIYLDYRYPKQNVGIYGEKQIKI